jgi:hypothetical protein
MLKLKMCTRFENSRVLLSTHFAIHELIKGEKKLLFLEDSGGDLMKVSLLPPNKFTSWKDLLGILDSVECTQYQLKCTP